MKITICGSIAFIDEMQTMKNRLEALKHEVKLPPSEITDKNGNTLSVKDYYALRKTTNTTEGWIWERKAEAMRNHFEKVIWADHILVLNHDKNGILNYIGPNTLLEMGLAFHHRKKIFLLKPIPELSYKEEILGMHPIVIFEDLSSIE